jgi:hypothetical protein
MPARIRFRTIDDDLGMEKPQPAISLSHHPAARSSVSMLISKTTQEDRETTGKTARIR